MKQILWWDWHCSKCGITGSVPIPAHLSILNANCEISDHHQKIRPICHTAYQSRWIAIRHVGPYDGKCRYGR